MQAKFKTPEERNKAFQNVYRTEEGRLVLEHIMESICNVSTEVLKPDDTATKAFYYGGMQAVGLRVKKILNTKPNEEGQ